MKTRKRLGLMVATFFFVAPPAFAEERGPVLRLPGEPSDVLPIKGDAGGLLLRDVNGDGFADLLLAMNNGGSQAHSAVYLSDKGRFAKPSWVADDPGVSSGIGLADLDGDGKEDLVHTRYNHNPASAYRGKGDGTFETTPFWQNVDSEWAYIALVGDFNGDGFNDILAEDRIYFGMKGGPDPVYSWKLEGRHSPSRLALADIDADGRQDLVITNWAGGCAWEVFRGVKGGFESEASSESKLRGEFAGLAAGDLNGDRFPEVIVGAVGSRGGDGRVRMYANEKGKLSAEPVWMSDDTECDTANLALADLDGDGDLDLFVLAGTHTAAFENRQGSLATQPFWRADVPGECFVLVDLDKNGCLDLVTGDRGKVCFYRGGPDVTPPAADSFAKMPALEPLTRRDLLPDMPAEVEALLDAWKAAATEEARAKAVAGARSRAAEVEGALRLMGDPSFDALSKEIAGDVEKNVEALVTQLGDESPSAAAAAARALVDSGEAATPILEKLAVANPDLAKWLRPILERIQAETPRRKPGAIEIIGLRLATLTRRLRKRYGLPNELEGVVVVGADPGVGTRLDLANISEGDVFEGIGSLMDYGNKVDPARTPLELLGLILKHDAEGEAEGRGWRLAGYRYVLGPLHPSERGSVRKGRINMTPKQWDAIKMLVAEPKPWVPER